MRTATIFSLLLLALLQSIAIAFSTCDNNFRDLKLNATYHFKSLPFDGAVLEECGCNVEYTCIRKCCAQNYYMDTENRTCAFNESSNEGFEVPYSFEKRTLLVPGVPNCTVYIEEGDQFVLSRNGKLGGVDGDFSMEYDQFCVERNENGDFMGILCFLNEDQGGRSVADDLNDVGILISLPFLLATLIIYLLLPVRNLHGNCLICYVLSLFVGFLFLICLRLNYDSLYGKDECLVLTISSIFFFLASFFWMNVMCIDIWWTFSGFNTRMKNLKRTQDRKRFLLYSSYAWGIPLLWIIIITSLTFTGTDEEVWYRPDFRPTCWFRKELTTLFFFYGPMALLIIFNMVLFVVTACKIRRAHQETAILKKDESKKHGDESDRQRFFLYVKLLLIMGVNWSMEIISWLIDWQIGNIPPAVWYLTDFCNALYGVLIFFLFCFNKKVWKMLKSRYYKCRGIQTDTSATTDTTRTSGSRYKSNDSEMSGS